MSTNETKVLSITIDAPYEAAYDFAHRPETFPQWAAGLSTSLRKTERGWVAETPAGQANIEFSPRNAYGVLDHWVRLRGKPEVYMPMRMVRNGDGVEVTVTLLRQPDMTDAMFEQDGGLIWRDLEALQRLLEGTGD